MSDQSIGRIRSVANVLLGVAALVLKRHDSGAMEATSCNQTSYRAGKKAYLYVGPGAKPLPKKAPWHSSFC